MSKMIEKRTMTYSKIRSMCISHMWFTRGDNEEYDAFMDKWANRHLTTEDLVEMAEELVKYSTPSSYREMELADIVWEINHYCCFCFEAVEG